MPVYKDSVDHTSIEKRLKSGGISEVRKFLNTTRIEGSSDSPKFSPDTSLSDTRTMVDSMRFKLSLNIDDGLNVLDFIAKSKVGVSNLTKVELGNSAFVLINKFKQSNDFKSVFALVLETLSWTAAYNNMESINSPIHLDMKRVMVDIADYVISGGTEISVFRNELVRLNRILYELKVF